MEMFWQCHSDGHDGIIYTDLLELCETCQTGVNDVDRWRQSAEHDDVMDFGAGLHDYITKNERKLLQMCGFSAASLFGGGGGGEEVRPYRAVSR